MPYINTKTNRIISEEQELVIKERLGKAIELIPGKTEHWLMVSFEPESSIYFRGKKDTGIAFVTIKLFGKAENKAYDLLTKEVTAILKEELSISGEGIYVQYEEVDHWGYNGVNF